METISNNIREEIYQNIGDTPTDMYALCYPNDPNPRKGAEYYARLIYASYINKCNKLPIWEAREQASKKSGLSTSELDILIISLIESNFRDLVEEETHMSWEDIATTSIEDLALLKPGLSAINDYIQVKAKPEELSSETLYKNNRYADNNLRMNYNSMYAY